MTQDASGPLAGSISMGGVQVLPLSLLMVATICWPGSPSTPLPVVRRKASCRRG